MVTFLLKETRFYMKLENDAVKCGICPNRCIIKPGKIGSCKTRKNIEGTLYSLVYSSMSSIAVDRCPKLTHLGHRLNGVRFLLHRGAPALGHEPLRSGRRFVCVSAQLAAT